MNLLINPEIYQRYLENQEHEDHNNRIIRQYIQDTYKDIVLEPEDQIMREYIRNGMLR
jgi:hypothetical protein